MSAFDEKIIDSKLDLIASIGKAESIRDYGGMWKVDGLYLSEGAKELGCKFASMVDKLPITDTFEKSFSGCEVEYTQGDFRDLHEVELPATEVSLLFDVLLHQNNFTEVIRQVCNNTTKYVVVAQPCYEGFTIPSSAALVQFMPEGWRKKLYNHMWINQDDQDEFNVDVWMWAQSMQLIIDLMEGYGWRPKEGSAYSFDIENDWEYSGIIFERK